MKERKKPAMQDDASPRSRFSRTGEASKKLGDQHTSQLDPSLQLQAGAPPRSRRLSLSGGAVVPSDPSHWSREVAIRKASAKLRTTAGINQSLERRFGTHLSLLPGVCLGSGEPMGQEGKATPLSDWLLGRAGAKRASRSPPPRLPQKEPSWASLLWCRLGSLCSRQIEVGVGLKGRRREPQLGRETRAAELSRLAREDWSQPIGREKERAETHPKEAEATRLQTE